MGLSGQLFEVQIEDVLSLIRANAAEGSLVVEGDSSSIRLHYRGGKFLLLLPPRKLGPQRRGYGRSGYRTRRRRQRTTATASTDLKDAIDLFSDRVRDVFLGEAAWFRFVPESLGKQKAVALAIEPAVIVKAVERARLESQSESWGEAIGSVTKIRLQGEAAGIRLEALLVALKNRGCTGRLTLETDAYAGRLEYLRGIAYAPIRVEIPPSDMGSGELGEESPWERFHRRPDHRGSAADLNRIQAQRREVHADLVGVCLRGEGSFSFVGTEVPALEGKPGIALSTSRVLNEVACKEQIWDAPRDQANCA